jgi:hypothetical protein
VSNIPVPRLLSYPVLGLLPKNLGPTPRPPTPELQHIVSRAVTPETLVANCLASYSGPALPRLDTLASLADQAPPSSPPSNALGLFFGPGTLLPPLSPLPTHDPRLGPFPSNFDPEDLTLCNEWDLPGASYIESDDDNAPTASRIIVSSLTDQTPIELPGRPDSALPSPPRSQASPSAQTFGAPSPPTSFGPRRLTRPPYMLALVFLVHTPRLPALLHLHLRQWKRRLTLTRRITLHFPNTQSPLTRFLVLRAPKTRSSLTPTSSSWLDTPTWTIGVQ